MGNKELIVDCEERIEGGGGGEGTAPLAPSHHLGSEEYQFERTRDESTK